VVHLFAAVLRPLQTLHISNWSGQVVILRPFYLLRHLAVLFNELPTPEACWSCRSEELYEEIVIAMGPQHDKDLNPAPF